MIRATKCFYSPKTNCLKQNKIYQQYNENNIPIGRCACKPLGPGCAQSVKNKIIEKTTKNMFLTSISTNFRWRLYHEIDLRK